MSVLRPGLDALIDQAVVATGSTAGWVVAATPSGLVVRAARSGAGATVSPASMIDRVLPSGGTCAYVMGSGQPVALQSTDDRGSEDAQVVLGRGVMTVLCVPCEHDDETIGALCLVDKAGGQPFSFDDVELATLLGAVSGGILAEEEHDSLLDHHRNAAALAGELGRLEEADPARFALVATVLDALLAR